MAVLALPPRLRAQTVGDAGYTAEKSVVELGASFLRADLAITSESRRPGQLHRSWLQGAPIDVNISWLVNAVRSGGAGSKYNTFFFQQVDGQSRPMLRRVYDRDIHNVRSNMSNEILRDVDVHSKGNVVERSSNLYHPIKQ